MSELRKQLEEAREEHLRASYPGDLGAELLGIPAAGNAGGPHRLSYAGARRRHWLFWANLGAMGAVAATVAIVMWRAQPLATPEKTNNPIAVLQTEDRFNVVPELDGGSLVPQDVQLVPQQEQAVSMPAMPSFPSLQDMNQETSNSKSQENS